MNEVLIANQQASTEEKALMAKHTQEKESVSQSQTGKSFGDRDMTFQAARECQKKCKSKRFYCNPMSLPKSRIWDITLRHPAISR
jgi:hypothetical protein